jgi:predicted nucleic acid-binding Zn ribbon protein
MEPLSRVLPAALREVLRQTPLSREKISFAWRMAVGPAIDRVTTVELTGDGTLEVRAPNQAWRRELTRSSGVILGRLAEMLGAGTVKTIALRVEGGHEETRPRRQAPRTTSRRSPARRPHKRKR